MALGPQDISNLNKFGAQLNQSVGQMSGTVSQMHGTLDSFATRLEDILDPEGAFKKGGEKAGKGFESGVTHAAKTFDKMIGGTATRFVKIIGGAGKGAGLALVGSFVATIFKNFEGIRKTTALAQKNLGMGALKAKEMAQSGQAMTRDVAAYRGQWDLVLKTAGSMKQEFLSIRNISAAQAEFATKMQMGFGVAAKDMGALMGVATQGLGLSEEASMGLVGSFQELAEGSGFTFAELVSQAAEGSSVMAAMGRTQLNDYRKLVLYTKQRGISMQKVQAFQEKDADYANILKNTMRTNILLGTKMNAREILRAKLQGNYVRFMDLTVGQTIKQGKWSDIDMFKKREMMKLTGLSMKELQKEYLLRRAAAKLITAEEKTQLDLINEAEKHASDRVGRETEAHNLMKKQSGIMDQIKATLLDGIIAPIQKFANDRFGGFEQMLDSILLTVGNIGTKVGEWVTAFLNLDDWTKIAIGIGTIVGPYLIGAMLSGSVISGAMTALMGGAGGLFGKTGMLTKLGGTGKGAAMGGVGKGVGGAALAISALTLGKDIYDAFSNRGSKKKKAIGKAVGGAIGGGIGFYLGGPLGAAVGIQLGRAAGGAIMDTGPTLAEKFTKSLDDKLSGLAIGLGIKKDAIKQLDASISSAFKQIEVDFKKEAFNITYNTGIGGQLDKKQQELVNKAVGMMYPEMKFAEAFEKFKGLSLDQQFLALKAAASKLAGEFESSVKSSKEWRQAELDLEQAYIDKTELLSLENKLKAHKAVLEHPGAAATKSGISVTEGKAFWGDLNNGLRKGEAALDVQLKYIDGFDMKSFGHDKLIENLLPNEAMGSLALMNILGADPASAIGFIQSIAAGALKDMTFKDLMTNFLKSEMIGFYEQQSGVFDRIASTKQTSLDLTRGNQPNAVNVKDFIVPANSDTVLGFDAGKLPMGGGQKEVVAAINNLAAALANRPTVVEIDGNEIVKTIYNKALNAG